MKIEVQVFIKKDILMHKVRFLFMIMNLLVVSHIAIGSSSVEVKPLLSQQARNNYSSLNSEQGNGANKNHFTRVKVSSSSSSSFKKSNEYIHYGKIDEKNNDAQQASIYCFNCVLCCACCTAGYYMMKASPGQRYTICNTIGSPVRVIYENSELQRNRLVADGNCIHIGPYFGLNGLCVIGEKGGYRSCISSEVLHQYDDYEAVRNSYGTVILQPIENSNSTSTPSAGPSLISTDIFNQNKDIHTLNLRHRK